MSIRKLMLLISVGAVALIVACGGESTHETRATSSSLPPTSTPLSLATPEPPVVVVSPMPQPLVTPTSTTSANEPDEAYLSERYEGRSIESFDEWQALVSNWEDRRPPYPGLLLFGKGATVGLKAIAQLRANPSLQNDKWQHCVWGSAIAGATSVATAEYHAWLKEQRDLTDGNPSSSFDEVDFVATLDGAGLATEGQECESCQEVCELRWGNRNERWNGQSPSDLGE